MEINPTKTEQCKLNREAVRIESKGVQNLLKCTFLKLLYFIYIYTIFTCFSFFNILCVKKMATKIVF